MWWVSCWWSKKSWVLCIARNNKNNIMPSNTSKIVERFFKKISSIWETQHWALDFRLGASLKGRWNIILQYSVKSEKSKSIQILFLHSSWKHNDWKETVVKLVPHWKLKLQATKQLGSLFSPILSAGIFLKCRASGGWVFCFVCRHTVFAMSSCFPVLVSMPFKKPDSIQRTLASLWAYPCPCMNKLSLV